MPRPQGDVVVDRMNACSHMYRIDAGAGAIVATEGVLVNGCLEDKSS